MEVEPDLARIDLGVSVLSATVAEATSEAADRISAVVASVEAFGIPSEEMRTSRYRVQPEYDHRNDRAELRGYRVSNVVTVTLRDLDRVGEVLEAATLAGGDSAVVEAVRFEVDDAAEARRRARSAAFAEALDAARQIADLAGVSLGSVVSVTERPGPGDPVPRAAMMESDASGATPIRPGRQAIAVTLAVEFGIEA